MISCKSEQERSAQKAIDRYVIFVDSVNKAEHKKRVKRWDFIEMEHTRKINDAKNALRVIKESDRMKQQERIKERYKKYMGVKASVK
jgi:hypothetical protein